MNQERLSLDQFPPEKFKGVKIDFRQELLPVVLRIAEVIPKDLIWNIYSSTTSETGGVIVFPYSRVDASVLIARDYVWMIDHFSATGDKLAEYYQSAAIQAFEALVWVEIGFQGLQNLAMSRASVNWTSAVGHFVNDEQRAIGIMTSGKKMYEECLGSFVSFRKRSGIIEDIFSKYNLTYLLDTIEI